MAAESEDAMILVGSLFLLIVLFFVHIFLNFSLRRYMENNHYGRYVELYGKSFTDTSISRQMRFLLFLKKREYEVMSDPKLTKRCVLYKRVSIAYIVVFALAVFSFIFNIASR